MIHEVSHKYDVPTTHDCDRLGHCPDIANRGIDVDDVTHVVNFEIPNEAETYVHRIGRTGRAGSEGVAVSFCTAEEWKQLRDIERLTHGGPLRLAGIETFDFFPFTEHVETLVWLDQDGETEDRAKVAIR